MTGASKPKARGTIGRWLAHHMPTREAIERNRVLRPVAHIVLEPALWRPTRRSVPRGIALGICTGILVPPLHFPASALLAFPFKANIPSAAATALVINPVTAPAFWLLGYRLGHWLLGTKVHVAAETGAARVVPEGWMHWLFHVVGPATLLGTTLVALAMMTLGYALSALAWRWWIQRKWEARKLAKAKPESI